MRARQIWLHKDMNDYHCWLLFSGVYKWKEDEQDHSKSMICNHWQSLTLNFKGKKFQGEQYERSQDPSLSYLSGKEGYRRCLWNQSGMAGRRWWWHGVHTWYRMPYLSRNRSWGGKRRKMRLPGILCYLSAEDARIIYSTTADSRFWSQPGDVIFIGIHPPNRCIFRWNRGSFCLWESRWHGCRKRSADHPQSNQPPPREGSPIFGEYRMDFPLLR